MSTEQPSEQIGIECPNCHQRTPNLKQKQRRKSTKRHGVGFWLATVFTLGLWALFRAIFGRKQLISSYECPKCSYQWSP